jgi:hypothetical protein
MVMHWTFLGIPAVDHFMTILKNVQLRPGIERVSLAVKVLSSAIAGQNNDRFRCGLCISKTNTWHGRRISTTNLYDDPVDDSFSGLIIWNSLQFWLIECKFSMSCTTKYMAIQQSSDQTHINTIELLTLNTILPQRFANAMELWERLDFYQCVQTCTKRHFYCYYKSSSSSSTIDELVPFLQSTPIQV